MEAIKIRKIKQNFEQKKILINCLKKKYKIYFFILKLYYIKLSSL